jgi:hypothetical protein
MLCFFKACATHGATGGRGVMDCETNGQREGTEPKEHGIGAHRAQNCASVLCLLTPQCSWWKTKQTIASSPRRIQFTFMAP